MIAETVSELGVQTNFLVDLGGHNTNRFPMAAGSLITLR